MTLPLLGAGPASPSSGPSVPSDIPGLKLDLDPTTLVLSDGNGIASWVDAASAATFAQATGSLQPLYKTNILGGKPIARFDGADDQLAGPNLSGFVTADAHTFVAVLKPTAIVGDSASDYVNDIVFIDQNGDLGLTLSVSRGASAYGYDSGVKHADVAISTGVFSRIEGRHEGGNLYVRKNGGADSAPTACASITDLATPTLIGRRSSGLFNGDLARLLVFNQAVSQSNRDWLDSYLKTLYGM